MDRTVLELSGVKKRFGRVYALDGVDLSIKRGEWVSIMGPSGSGKTTLLNIVACLDVPSHGTYRLDGVDVRGLSEDGRTVLRREKIGLVFQQFHLVPYLTAVENVMLAQYYHSAVDEKTAKEALERVGLAHRVGHLPSQLSGGEQQRVCIARALINEPAIILADEPTGNLDEQNESSVLSLFSEFHREGRTLILVTHNIEIGKSADRLIELHHGKVSKETDLRSNEKPR